MSIKASLTYNQMQEGMVILSAVRQITNLALQIEFPGLTFGQVRITSISDPLNKYLSQHMNDVDTNDILKKLFCIGSFIPAKVMRLEANEKGHRVEASINPKDINAGRRHNSFRKGMLVWASVQSELDHGYQLASGLGNCKIFLPTKNIDEGQSYEIGEPLWCVVHRCDESQNSSILRVSAKWEHINLTKTEDLDTLHNIIPGMLVELFVDRVSKHGVEGKFLDDYHGYVDQAQLASPLHTLDRVKEGTLKKARVLYVEPVTNITHLTLRGLEPVEQPKLEIGHVTKVEVMVKSPRGLFVKVNKDEKGFVTNKRLLRTLPKQEDSDLTEAVRKKYPTGSKHQCRVIDYNHMERVYICTFETDIIKEKVFITSDLSVGQAVNVTVEDVKSDGVVVCAGHLKGFAANMHLTNTKFSEAIKKKFAVGSHFKARVWNITEQGNVSFTLKQTLVESNECFKDIHDADPNTMYPGVVILAKESGALVGFYAGIVGWIGTKQLAKDHGGRLDPRDYFYRGQVSFFRLLHIRNNRLSLASKPLSSVTPENTQRKNQHSNSKVNVPTEETTNNTKSAKKRKQTQSECENKPCTDSSDNIEVPKKKKKKNSTSEEHIISEDIKVENGITNNETKKSKKNNRDNKDDNEACEENSNEKKKKQKVNKVEISQSSDQIRNENNKGVCEQDSNKKKKKHKTNNEELTQSSDEVTNEDDSEACEENSSKKKNKRKDNNGEIVQSIDEGHKEWYEQDINKSKKKKKANKEEVTETCDGVRNEMKIKKKKEEKDLEQKQESFKKVKGNINSTPLLPGIGDFYSGKQEKEDEEESSSDEETPDEKVSKKKKKLTPAERAELARQEEERIRRIEKELANSKSNPQTAEHFDRLVLGQPNSSELWLQYMAYHVSLTELDKARAVAKRALETINMTLLQDKLNVWIAYLHLENMYGTKETFEKVFEDAVRYNDSMKVYLKTTEMLAESGKISEMEEKVRKLKAKYKQSPEMWESIGKVYYLLKNFREARNCKDLAIKSIQDKKIQLNLIIRFAIMEFKYGEEDQGAAIFETILQSDPRKVNIWITYVDQLVKKGSIDLARSILDRSVCQKLPAKSMKTLFMKFRMFEEKHGTPEAVQDLKRRAAEYVKNNS